MDDESGFERQGLQQAPYASCSRQTMEWTACPDKGIRKPISMTAYFVLLLQPLSFLNDNDSSLDLDFHLRPAFVSRGDPSWEGGDSFKWTYIGGGMAQ